MTPSSEGSVYMLMMPVYNVQSMSIPYKLSKAMPAAPISIGVHSVKKATTKSAIPYHELAWCTSKGRSKPCRRISGKSAEVDMPTAPVVVHTELRAASCHSRRAAELWIAEPPSPGEASRSSP